MSPENQPALLSPERVAEIAAREQAATPGDWTEIQVLDHEGCQVWPWEREEDMNFAYHARQDIPALLTDRAARDKQVATELAGLLSPEPTEAQIWDSSPAGAAKAWAAKVQNEAIRAVAARLGIDLTTPSTSSQ